MSAHDWIGEALAEVPTDQATADDLREILETALVLVSTDSISDARLATGKLRTRLERLRRIYERPKRGAS